MAQQNFNDRNVYVLRIKEYALNFEPKKYEKEYKVPRIPEPPTQVKEAIEICKKEKNNEINKYILLISLKVYREQLFML